MGSGPCNMFKSPQAFISSLLVAPRPLFPWHWPTPPIGFSPRPWIFLHETSNRIGEYVQISMDGDYRRVACNIFKSSQTFISSLSVAPRPFFPYYWPISHPWICSPIRRFFSTSTSNRIDEYVQRSMDGGTEKG